MKKTLILALLALFTLSCGEKKGSDTTPTLTLSVSPASLSFQAEDASNKLVTISTNGSWTATPADSWIHLDKTSGTGNGSITVTVSTQEDQASRSANILFISSLSGQEKNASVMVNQSGNSKPPVVEIVPKPAEFDGTKRASTTYQLLIYSFADSDGDGVGDFKGIENNLPYLDSLGVTALWLSPAHPTGSYHGYDVNDYFALNSLFGAEEDFKNLIDAAHSKGIKIYMDYVLNHSGTGTEWFKSVKADPKNSPYRDYYVLSNGSYAPEAVGGMGGWISLGDGEIGYNGRLHFKVQTSGGKPSKVTVSKTSEPVTGNVSNPGLWIYTGNDIPMAKTGDNVYEVTADINTSWGFLVRTVSGSEWPDGSKYGAKSGSNVVSFDNPLSLVVNGLDIVFGETTSYYASFDGSMPDLNYGAPDDCENSRAFKSTVESATKWVNMGVDGFRLDAVVWVYAANTSANVKFLSKWYDAVNSAYKAAGHTDDIFMVGEAWDKHSVEKNYYAGLTSCFEFDYWWENGSPGPLLKAVNSGSASQYVDKVSKWITEHKQARTSGDAVTSFFMTNHDQNRAASYLSGTDAQKLVKEKQAAAMLLTTPEKPFVYQGEELGYYGTKDGGDEYVRTPIKWDKAGKDCAKKGVNNKVDNTMLNKSGISVDEQKANENSLLNVYKTWSRLRNTYPALAEGEMSATSLSGSSIASWYMTAGSQKLLVIHNVSTSEKKVTVSDSMEKPIALLGTASYQEKELTLGPNSSVVFEL